MLTGDIVACGVSALGCGLALFPYVNNVHVLVIAVLLVIHILSIYMETTEIRSTYLIEKNWKLRPRCGQGTYCTILIPLAVILSTYYKHGRVYFDGLHLLCLGLMIQSAIIHGNTCGQNYTRLKQVFEVLMPCANVASFHILHLVKARPSEVALVHVVVFLSSYIHSSTIQWLPWSFSPGEGSLVSQGVTVLMVGGLLSKPMSGKQIEVFLRVAGGSCLLVVFILFTMPTLQNSIGFYAVTLLVAVGFATPLIYSMLKQNFISWIIEFVTLNSSRMYLFLYWGICCTTATVIVMLNAWRLWKASSKSRTISGGKDSAPGMAPTIIIRKHFHVFALVVFLPGLVWDKEMLLTAATCAIIVFVMLEVVRKCLVWPLGRKLDDYLKVFIDVRDSGPVILTHIYLLVGCTLPLWLFPALHRPGIHPALLSGLLSLGVGDTVAAIVGTKYGHTRWPGTSKTVEGTVAGIILQMVAVFILQVSGVIVDLCWLQMVWAIVLSSLLEAFTSQIDNLVLPLFMYILLL